MGTTTAGRGGRGAPERGDLQKGERRPSAPTRASLPWSPFRGRQPHELILSELAPGKTSADFAHWIETQEGPPPVQPYGGATDLPPGGTIVLDVKLEPGRCSAVCRVRDAVDGQPHDQHGMTTDFVVP